MSDEVQIYEADAMMRTLAIAPQVVLDEAAQAARALRAVIAQKPRKVVMNGEQYLEFEDWQTVGRFYGITAAEVGEPEFVALGDAAGFKATSVALDQSGRELSRATAYCLSDEDKWSSRSKYEWAYALRSGGHSVEDPGPDELIWEDNPNKPGKKRPRKERVHVGEERVPLFQLASMAQTRANAKALRNVLSWVVVLAGYRTTPAEEMGAAEVVEVEAVAAPKPPERAAPESPRASTPAPAQAGPACPHCGKTGTWKHFPSTGETVCYPPSDGCGKVITKAAKK